MYDWRAIRPKRIPAGHSVTRSGTAAFAGFSVVVSDQMGPWQSIRRPAKSIERTSEDALKVDHGSLYPALQRLLQEGWITAKWGVSENSQRARYYRLTARGKRKLVDETSRWERFVRAISDVLMQVEPRKEE